MSGRTGWGRWLASTVDKEKPAHAAGLLRMVFGAARKDASKRVEAAGIALGFEIVPYPQIPLEQLYVEQKATRWRRSRHTKDLRRLTSWVLGLAVVFMGIVCVLVVLSSESWAWDDVAKAIVVAVRPEFFAALITSAAAAMAALFQFGKQRFSTSDVFSSEIAARIRILAADNTVKRIIELADPARLDRIAREMEKGARNADGVEPSEERQFENFHRRSTDLGALGSSVVDHVTAFYSHHMAARDELRTLSRMTGSPATTREEMRDQVCNVIFMVDLMAMSAIQALDDLIETREHLLYCVQLSLCVATAANAHLIASIAPTDHRHPEILKRNAAYAERIASLKRGLRGRPPKERSMVVRGREYL